MMRRGRLYLIIIVLALAAGIVVFVAQKRRHANAGCDTPAPVQAATPAPKLPDFIVEAPCGPDGAKAPAKK